MAAAANVQETVTLLLSLPGARIVSITDGAVGHVAEGTVEVVAARASDEEMMMLACGSFSYPLIDQVAMKSDERIFVLPAGRDGITSYVLTLDASLSPAQLAAFEEMLSRYTDLRMRNTKGRVSDVHTHAPSQSTSGGASGSAGGAGCAGSRPSSRSGTAAPADGAAKAPSAAAAAAAAADADDSGHTGTGVMAAAAAAAPSVAEVVHAVATIGSAVGSAAYQAGTTAAQYLPESVRSISAADAGQAVSSALLTGGKVASTALVTGAEYAGWGVRKAAQGLMGVISRTEAPVKVSAETKARVEQAAMVSKSAVVISASLVMGAATVAKSLGAAVSGAFLSTDYGKSWQAKGDTETGKAMRQVAASGLVAFADVWDGLETAAKVFGSHASVATKDLVHHTYGEEAGKVATRSLEVAADVGVAALNMRQVGLGGLVRRTAAETAREIVSAGGDPLAATPRGTAGNTGGAPGRLALPAPAIAATTAAAAPAATPAPSTTATTASSAPRGARGGAGALPVSTAAAASGTASAGASDVPVAKRWPPVSGGKK